MTDSFAEEDFKDWVQHGVRLSEKWTTVGKIILYLSFL